MFTGIVTDVGFVKAIDQRGDRRFTIVTRYPADSIDIGASIACSGVCLTVVERGFDDGHNWFAVDVSQETLDRTMLGDWQRDSIVNLERSLRVGDELGGHIVAGHVDAVGTIVSVTEEGGSHRVVIDVPDDIAAFIAEKGSVAINGVSLTVNEVEDSQSGTRFGINIIPHTWDVTTFRHAKDGDRVNVEIDTLARYVARIQQKA